MFLFQTMQQPLYNVYLFIGLLPYYHYYYYWHTCSRKYFEGGILLIRPPPAPNHHIYIYGAYVQHPGTVDLILCITYICSPYYIRCLGCSDFPDNHSGSLSCWLIMHMLQHTVLGFNLKWERVHTCNVYEKISDELKNMEYHRPHWRLILAITMAL